MREDPDYAEMFAGEWQNQQRDNFIHQWFNYEDPPGGESFDAFFARIKRAKLRCLSAGHRLPLVVCHGGVFRAFGKLYDLQIAHVKNCALYRFDPTDAHSSFPWQVQRFTLRDGMLQNYTDKSFPV
jgi:broad specificity phosphatase PhoE